MQDSPSNQAGHSASPTRTSRRAIVSWTMKLAGGAALAASVPGTHWVQLAAAQDDEIILTAAASEVGARPGGAYANGAAARAVADSEAGSSTQGAGSIAARRRPGLAPAPVTLTALDQATKMGWAVAAPEAALALARATLLALAPVVAGAGRHRWR